ncbi:S28 family serine protease [Nonomuraea sp. NPDC050556]|uniref:S28 family serine protease n=1 Tax=Nonomuraea sp. NPDC050556 TaxID=3364369 RepID=UPI0037B9F473
MKRALAAVAVIVLLVTGQAAQASTPDILDQLKAVPGMHVEEKESALAGQRWFWLTFRQPIDHRDPRQGWFEQRLMVQHRSTDLPMVFHTTGHNVPETMFEVEPTKILGANQISMEYRYYFASTPVPTDWSKDTLWQGAADQHRIVEALKRIYVRKWIGTGASKGGQAAVVHRRYFPQDVAGTVAYVAPNNLDDNEDSAFDRFLDHVGSQSQREHLRALARQFLERRPAMLRFLRADAAREGWTFQTVGSMDRGFENAVMEYEIRFWMHTPGADQVTLPPVDASDEVLYRHLRSIPGFGFFTDQTLVPYAPAFYQAEREIGWPSLTFPHLRPLLRYEDSYDPRSYLSRDIQVTQDQRVVREVDEWVRRGGNRLMFVNGGDDPATAEPYRLGSGSRDSAVYTAPGIHHDILGEIIDKLPEWQKGKAIADLRRWAR